jgi:sugar O-acyltransferase (sialic acid O-acetyltransferase NeuD family)
MEDIVIFGAGGFGREVAWLIDDLNRVRNQYSVLGFIVDDSVLKGELLNGHVVLGGLEYLEGKKGLSAAIALGDPVSRMRVLTRFAPYNLRYPNLIHPSAMIGTEVRIGIGNIICAGSILTVNINMGSFCQLNLHTTVGHDAVLQDFATTACGVDLAGHSHIGLAAYMGNHSTVLPSVNVGAFATVGAGAVVNRDLPVGVTAVGVPAKVVKESQIYDEMKGRIPVQLSSVSLSSIRQSL